MTFMLLVAHIAITIVLGLIFWWMVKAVVALRDIHKNNVNLMLLLKKQHDALMSGLDVNTLTMEKALAPPKLMEYSEAEIAEAMEKNRRENQLIPIVQTEYLGPNPFTTAMERLNEQVEKGTDLARLATITHSVPNHGQNPDRANAHPPLPVGGGKVEPPN